MNPFKMNLAELKVIYILILLGIIIIMGGGNMYTVIRLKTAM